MCLYHGIDNDVLRAGVKSEINFQLYRNTGIQKCSICEDEYNSNDENQVRNHDSESVPYNESFGDSEFREREWLEALKESDEMAKVITDNGSIEMAIRELLQG